MFSKSQGFKEGLLDVAVSLVEHRSVFKFNCPLAGSVIGWAGLAPDYSMPPGLPPVAHILGSVKNWSIFFSGLMEDAQLCRIRQLPRS